MQERPEGIKKSEDKAKNIFLSHRAEKNFKATPGGTRDLGSLTKVRTQAPALGAQSLNHWTAREVPIF